MPVVRCVFSFVMSVFLPVCMSFCFIGFVLSFFRSLAVFLYVVCSRLLEFVRYVCMSLVR